MVHTNFDIAFTTTRLDMEITQIFKRNYRKPAAIRYYPTLRYEPSFSHNESFMLFVAGAFMFPLFQVLRYNSKFLRY